MAVDHRAKLATIKRFDQLLAYLRDEMDWPIERIEIDDLMFEYTPEELGIDTRSAAKIEEIKRLRPLSTHQPWGIFFIKFEPKRLPVVALRRILSQVVLKKRATGKAAGQVAWAADDLLFVSNYGEGDERHISFAHFSQPEARNDLPTLKVLGWDNLDTLLHLGAVAKELITHLAWPEDENNTNAWRQKWSAAFTLRHREVITTSRELSIQLAKVARAIRDRIKTSLAIETERGPLTKLLKAFQEALVHDLDAKGFADMYAQTITYGLLSARIADPKSKTADDLSAHMKTSPFLRELMATFIQVGGRRGKAGGKGIDFDELGVNEVVELLDDANMEAVIRDFGDRNPQEDPVIHFYELFLKEYDADQKAKRGVFYTPRPVVSYIVRSVDELLRTEFGLEDGLADTATWGEMVKRHKKLTIPESVSPGKAFIQILDPATGTGTFLVEVIDIIHRTLIEKWQAQGYSEKKIEALWNEYVPKHLLPRLHGFEILMAPYAIAHMKIGLKLYETGYHFISDERARIYLTNALEPTSDSKKQMEFKEWLPALAQEAQAVDEIKRHQLFTVVIGNPPYSIYSCNLQESAISLVDQFRYVDGEKIKERGALKFETILQDDYVKFWGLGLRTLQCTPSGIISMISNNGFLTNRVLRGVRKAFLNNFTRLAFLDLHGNRSKGEACPDGSRDDNVFDINQGVGISILWKAPAGSGTSKTELADLWGSRDVKYRTLSNSAVSHTPFQEHFAKQPYYAFARVDGDMEDEYRDFVGLDDAMPFNKAGFVSGRDDFAVDFEIEPLEARISDFLNPRNSDSTVRERYSIKDAGGYELTKRRQPALAAKLKAKDIIRKVQHRPFDYRFVAYSEAVLTSPQKAAMHQLIASKNIAFCLSRGAEIIRGWEHIFCTRAIVQHHTVSLKEVNYVFPLNVIADEDSLALGTGMLPNFGRDFFKSFTARLSIDRAYRLSRGFTPEVIFNYIYAVLHAPSYRNRYAEFLKIDFPRVPLPSSFDLFRDLAHLGGELIALHLMESPKLNKFITSYVGPKNPEVTRVGWSDDTVWLDASATKKGQPATPGTIGFQGVPEAVWKFHIGGYQVCEKWLKDRKGRTLSKDDIEHYQKIVVALSETIRIMGEIDRVINEYGGWPTAFAKSGDEVVEPLMTASTDTTVVPFVEGIASVSEEEPELILKAAEPEAPAYDTGDAPNQVAKRITPDELDTEEIICLIRQLFSDVTEQEREAAIRELAHQMGYQRISSHIYEELDHNLRTAVRRGIIENRGNSLAILTRNIGDFDRNFLKDQFIVSLQGSNWKERDDAIRSFSRWLGFRRTGPAIDETARSLINGLIREDRLESEDSKIRKKR